MVPILLLKISNLWCTCIATKIVAKKGNAQLECNNFSCFAAIECCALLQLVSVLTMVPTLVENS